MLEVVFFYIVILLLLHIIIEVTVKKSHASISLDTFISDLNLSFSVYFMFLNFTI